MTETTVAAGPTATPDPDGSAHPSERRIIRGLMGGSAFGGLGQLIGLTGTALLIEDLLGSKTFIGTGNCAMQVGTAMGAILLTRWLGKRHRRPPLVAGYVVGALGGLLIGFAASWESYPLVLLGLMLFGFGNTAGQQARFAAADVVPDARRGRAVSIVVWSTTIGVVFGPKLWGPAGRAMEQFGFTELGGAYVVGGAVFVIAAIVCLVTLRPDPRDISRQLRPEPSGPPPRIDLAACLQRPKVRLAIGTLVVGQVVMVALMSVTSVHLRDHGHSSGTIGTLISLHVLGMYAPSPISGWLVDRSGRMPVIVFSNAIMIAGCVMAAAVDPSDSTGLTFALFLLGLGWNGNFVAGSTLVTEAVSSVEHPRVQAFADSCTFFASGIAALLAGFVLHWSNYTVMGVATACIAALCTVVVVTYNQVTRRVVLSPQP